MLFDTKIVVFLFYDKKVIIKNCFFLIKKIFLKYFSRFPFKIRFLILYLKTGKRSEQ